MDHPRKRSSQNDGVQPLAYFKITVKPDSFDRLALRDSDDIIGKAAVQNAALQRLLRSGKFTYNLLMRLINIKKIPKLNKTQLKKYKRSQEKYVLMIRNVLRKTSVDTYLELDLESLTNLRQGDSQKRKIKGKAIVPNIPKEVKEIRHKPILFETKLDVEDRTVCDVQGSESSQTIPEKVRGIIRYQLSDRTFIDKGWTKLPVEKVVQKRNVYRVLRAHPEFDWFINNKEKGPMTYDTGEKLAEFDDNGRGRWYYKNGRIALRYYDCEEKSAQQRYLVYSSGEPDSLGRSRPVTLLAMFDILGNGIVFDHAGKIRIKYNQSDGVVLDRGIGPVSHWKWHSLNDPPVLQRVMMDTYTEKKDPKIMLLESSNHKMPRQDFSDMLEIEYRNCIRDQTKKITQKFKPYQIKMKALKINEQFSLRIVDQANVHLNFKEGSVNFKLNLGMVVDNHQILHTETEDLGDVTISLDKSRGQADSILDLQRDLHNVCRLDHVRASREAKINPIIPEASVDRITAPRSKPLHGLRTVKSKTSNSSCKRTYLKKPLQPNLYYNNRLF